MGFAFYIFVGIYPVLTTCANSDFLLMYRATALQSLWSLFNGDLDPQCQDWKLLDQEGVNLIAKPIILITRGSNYDWSRGTEYSV